ncbi:hypothetical protein A2W54_01930 [Candidatus Giovannonibacteria bacterium RIFCSPHIGHO2_02_43_13]|uniref:DUF4446 domain-containing protein n=1 Tax=Candidatus Giovannonibacteria bacterium RIFCSPHIGHO2_02_43_13 TaxID=1798330 RepID=A0A1F5WU94_9BACT|nr:MAG: hypothetical protein A2W54_01930 [Candidatus Giovannonibacteria bacterium RIFCSPHIGHO2_02_43_13]
MSSEMKLFFEQYIIYAVLGLLFFDALLAFWIFYLRKNIRKIFRSGSTDLEKVLLELRQNEVAFEEALKSVVARVGKLENELPRDLRRVGLVRYNPFSDSGGDQSFALAILNDQNDGIVLSSLYGREMNRVYAKLIKHGRSQYQLTEEEKKAIESAV